MVDYKDVFVSLPASYVILDPDYPNFTVVAVTDSYLQSVNLTRQDMMGRPLFAPFNKKSESDYGDALKLFKSLEKLIITKKEQESEVLKYDVKLPDGSFQTRFWNSKNVPLFDSEGNVKLIIHCPIEITHLVNLGLHLPQ